MTITIYRYIDNTLTTIAEFDPQKTSEDDIKDQWMDLYDQYATQVDDPEQFEENFSTDNIMFDNLYDDLVNDRQQLPRIFYPANYSSIIVGFIA